MSYDPIPNLDAMARQGKTFAASSDVVGWTSFGRIRAALTNPVNSGRVVHLIAVVSSNASPVSGTIRQWHGPTVGVPTAIAPVPAKNCCLLPTLDPTQAAKAVFYADSGTLTTTITTNSALIATLPLMAGGTLLPTLVVPAQDRQVFGPSPLILMPGTTLGLDASFGAVGSSGNSIVSLYWMEDLS